MLALPGYRTNYDNRFYVPKDVPSNIGYAAAEKHFTSARMNPDMLMVESDHDLRNSRDMMVLDRVAKLPRMSAEATRTALIEDLESCLGALPLIRTSEAAGNRAGAAMGHMLIAKLAMWNKDYDKALEAIAVLDEFRAGKLGRALLGYSGFAEYGLNIVAAFDENDAIIGTSKSGKPIMHLSRLGEICRREQIKIGIITVPAEQAQGVCDLLISNGILAIWNFAPKHLNVPDHILVQNENRVCFGRDGL